VPTKFVCKWISLLIPRSLNSKLTVNLKNFIKFHEPYKSVTNLFSQKKGSLPFCKIRESESWVKMFSLGRWCVHIQRWNWKSSLCVGLGCCMSKGLHVVIIECDPIVVMPSHPRSLPLGWDQPNTTNVKSLA
jgi:hypothetical protein